MLENQETKTLIKVDRNGTKYYDVTSQCCKCGGKGVIKHFIHNQAGVCFDCKGYGVIHTIEKEYTPEYATKLAERRAAREAKKEAEKQSKLQEQWNELFKYGKVWIVLGNTFRIKDEIKQDGGFYDMNIGWYFTNKPEDGKYEVIEAIAEDAFNIEEPSGNKFKGKEGFETPIIGEYKGEVGGIVDEELTYIDHDYFTKKFYHIETGYHVHTFKDSNNNILVWVSTVNDYFWSNEDQCYEIGAKFHIKGRIKECRVKGKEKQTVLTRCKVKTA